MSAFVRTRPARPVQSMINGIARWAGKDALTALQDIKADWAPVMEPVLRPNGQAIENKMSVINPVADKVLGITSTNYGGMHNRLLVDGIDKMAQALSLPYQISRADMFGDGESVRLEAILGDAINLGDADTIYKVVSAHQGHGGTHPFSLTVEFKRLVCSNGLMVKVPGLSTAFRCKHTQNGAARVEWNFSLVQKSFEAATGDIEKAFRLFSEKRMSQTEAMQFFRDYAVKIGHKDAKLEQTVSDLMTTYANPRQELAGNTLWRAFNTLTEWNQHTGYRTDEAMLLDNISGAAAKAKQDAFQFALAVAA